MVGLEKSIQYLRSTGEVSSTESKQVLDNMDLRLAFIKAEVIAIWNNPPEMLPLVESHDIPKD